MTDLETDLAIARRTIAQYDIAFLELREKLAVAVFAVQELTAALRDMTIRALGEEMNR